MTTQALQGHTPGPWIFRYYRNELGGHAAIESQRRDLPHNDPVVLEVREDWIRYLDETPEGQANARLIAAAPAMLEALQAALWDLEHPPSGLQATIGTVRAAIAQATGQ